MRLRISVLAPLLLRDDFEIRALGGKRLYRIFPILAEPRRLLADIRGTYLPTGLGQFGEFGRRPPRERRPVPGRRAFYTPSVHNTDFNS